MVRRSKFLLYAAVLALAMVLGGCALTPVVVDTAMELVPTPQVEDVISMVMREPLPMEEKVWVLQSLNGVAPYADVEITMEFRLNAQFPTPGSINDIIQGRAVCNGYAVAYELNGSGLSVSDVLTQSAAECLPESYNDFEQQYFEILTHVEFYEHEGDSLTLSTEDGDTLVFSAQVEEPTPVVTREPLPLEQTVWVLQSLNGVPPFPDVEITMEFRPNDPDGGSTLRGRDVCNGYGVPYALDGQSLIVIGNELESSAEGCLPESYNDLEQLYYAVLSRVVTYELEGDRLTLLTDDGDALVFSPQ